MNKLEKHLKCPSCLSNLKEFKKTLVCSKGKHQFNVKEGIPILLDYSNLPTHSQNQQVYFEKRMRGQIIDSAQNISYWKVQYLERFSQNFKKIKNKLIIEIGVGSGYMAIGLAKLGAKVTACDITLKNLVALKKFAESRGLEDNLSFVCCSADSLPFKENVFDYIVINSVLEHIPKEEEAISEIGRVLKKGGGLMITVPVKYRYIFPLLLPLNFFHDKRIGHLRRYDSISLKSKFPNFSLKKIYFTGHPFKVIKVIINMLIKVFDEKAIEEGDRKKDHIMLWSSNLIAFFNKK